MNDQEETVLRSFLFCPATNARRLAKTLVVDTDAVIVDLEDAVAVAEKPAARALAAAFLAAPRDRRRIYVRVNALSAPWSFADFQAVVVPHLDGIVLPKAESAADIQTADHVIAGWETERGLVKGNVELLPIIETAKGVEATREILRASPRVRRVCFGAGDFTNDTDTVWSRDNPVCAHARAQLVIASRAAEREPPIDTVWAHLNDQAGLEAEAEEAKRLGFGGKLCIHPDQLAAVHRIFSPTEKQLANARKIRAAFEAAERDGVAAIVVDGVFVDYPAVHRALRVLATAERIAQIASARSNSA
jgi:citrate lyase subunit beta / citryl-CoA lyase